MRGGAAARRPLVLDGTRGSVAAAEEASWPSAKPAGMFLSAFVLYAKQICNEIARRGEVERVTPLGAVEW
jgi:hypothetical protein